MSKPKATKYALFPNLWEFLNLVASVLGLGTKATVWGNNKTFYESGFLPVESANGDVNAVDILRHIVAEAQRKGKLNKFHKGVWQSVWGFQHENEGETYEQLAKSCIDDYVKWVRAYNPNMKMGLDFWGIYGEYLKRRSKNENGEANKQYRSFFEDPLFSELLVEYIDWKNKQNIRMACIDIVCNFLGEEFREKCKTKYNELFQNTFFSTNDYQNLITKDLKDWTNQDKALAFSIPFSGFSQKGKYQLYSEVLDRVVSNPDRLARNGSKHPNKWIDQFTELGYFFGWMADKKLDDISKQVLRREKSKKEEFGRLETLTTKVEVSELIDSVKEELGPDIKKYRETFAETVLVKGSGRQINHVLSELSHQLPKDAFHQIKSGFVIDELLRSLNVLSSDSYESHRMWMTASKYYPFLGSTGYLCKKRLLPYIPQIRNFIQKYPKVVEILLIMIVSVYSVKNKLGFKKIQQEKIT